MEKSAGKRSKIFSFLPKTATVSFHHQNPPFSPGRDKRSETLNKIKANAGKGFSGPIISIIPAEARRKSKNGSFHEQEPTSPKISCMGQIKHKKKISKSKGVSPFPHKEKKPKHSSLSIRNIFRGAKSGHKSDASADKPPVPDRAPSIGQMKRFASGRNAFADFDWKNYDGKISADHRSYHSDDEEKEESDEVFIPHSAPMMLGGGVVLEPRKEINLWKRRTMSPPMPLQLNGI